MILKDRVAVVTGAARGIGREIALLMARLGARVVVNDYGGSEGGQGATQAPANEVVEEIRKAGGQAVANYDSVATMAGGEHIVQTAIDAFGRVDIVVNNAGILRDRMIFNMTEEEWDAVLNTHLKGTFAVTRAAAPRMKEQRAGRFINMTSTSGLVGNIGQANYAAAKLGIVGLTKVVALDMARYNVTANCISPFAWTRMIGTIPTETDAQKARVEKIKKMSRPHCPGGGLPRLRCGQGHHRSGHRGPGQGDHALRAHASHHANPSRRRLDGRTPVRDVRRNAAAPPRPARHVWSVFQLRPSRLAHSAVRFSDGGGDSLAAQIFVSLTIELSTKNFVKSSSPSSKFV